MELLQAISYSFNKAVVLGGVDMAWCVSVSGVLVLL